MSTVVENIKNYLERDPFLPFRIVMSSGEHYDIKSPLGAALLKSEVFVVLPDGDHWANVPFLHISSIETIKNGRGRRGGGRKRK